jgi:hypothetical protein
MRKILFALCVTAMVPLAYGQWTTPGSTDATKEPAAAAAGEKNALTTAPNADATNAKQLLGERNCLRETGSNIVRKDKCVVATGQAYGGTAIERTGTYDTGTALDRLSPAVNVRGAVH